MTPVVGNISLNLAFGFSVLSIIILSIFLRTGDYRLYLTGRRLSIGVSLLSIWATIILGYQLISSNFEVDYVAHYTSRETPLLYKFSALWAGQSGSLLFWVFILSLFALTVILQNKNTHKNLMPWVIIIITAVELFFLVLINFVTNPFLPVEADIIVANGLGLNPLLQNLTMAIHPPLLYLGYVGFTIPFAFGISALINKDTSSLWIQSVRRWSLMTWLFLSCGIILGGWWAYQELGWGGYWAWDPVENASLMPWLTATAFVHSIVIQEKKNMLRVWNMVLIILTFTLCIFGTFLTRSGIMSSVHSFATSSLGPLFLGFVFLILIFSISLLLYRLPIMKSEKKMESFSSRESGFLFNNVIFVVMCFAVFWGTIFPVLTEAVRGVKITVGAPFFNQINAPLGMVLLLLTGVGPLLAWRRTSRQSLIRNFALPVSAGLLTAILLLMLNLAGYVVISFSLSVFVLIAMGSEFYRGIKARMSRFGENPITALITIISKNRSRYGGYIVHLGIVFMFVGFTGNAFNEEKEFGIKVGQEEHVGNYRIKLSGLSEAERSNHYAFIANLRITDSRGNFIANLRPEKRIYNHRNPDPNRQQPHSELDIYSTMIRDIYSVFSGVDKENQTAFLKIMINPLVNWVWIGGYILIIGTMIALWPRKDEV